MEYYNSKIAPDFKRGKPAGRYQEAIHAMNSNMTSDTGYIRRKLTKSFSNTPNIAGIIGQHYSPKR